jgi:hypothetical protein
MLNWFQHLSKETQNDEWKPSGRTAKVQQTLRQARLHRFRVASAEQSRRGRLRMTTLYSHPEFISGSVKRNDQQ